MHPRLVPVGQVVEGDSVRMRRAHDDLHDVAAVPVLEDADRCEEREGTPCELCREGDMLCETVEEPLKERGGVRLTNVIVSTLTVKMSCVR